MKGPEYYDKMYEKGYDWEAYKPMYEKIAKFLPKNKDARILDAGCGAGGFLKVCEEKGYTNLRGWDFSEKAVDLAQKIASSATIKCFDVNSTLPSCGTYDCIVMIELLEHIENDKRLLINYMDSLKKNGFILGSVPNSQMGPEITESHVRVYDERSFMERFSLPGRLLYRSIPGEKRLNFIMFKFYRTPPKPKVSFVIPAYGGDHYLSETIRSILDQTIEEIELIVVNDNSPDYTHDLMQWWVKNDCRIRYFPLKENKGVVYARNFGNKRATAPIILVSDQDDLSSPERAEKTLRVFKNNPKADVLYSAYHETDVDGSPLTKYDAEPMSRDIFKKGTWKTWFHSSAAYRRKDILELPYKVGRNGETDDWMFLDRWTKAGKVFHPIQEVLANCRRLPSGVMAQRRRESGLPPNYQL